MSAAAVLAIVVWGSSLFVGRRLGERKNRHGMAYGFFLSWIGVLILVLLPARTGEAPASLARAKALFEDGDSELSAHLVWQVRARAIASHDTHRLGEVDAFLEAARMQLAGEHLANFDAIVSGEAPMPSWLVERTPESDELPVDTSALGFWLGVAGAVAVVVAVFLPEASSPSFGGIVNNTLIQNSDGWIAVGLALVNLLAIYRAYVTRGVTWGPLITGALVIGLAVYDGASSSALRVCSVVDPTSCERASPGVGLYLVGLGGLFMVFGGWQLRRAAPTAALSDASTGRPSPGVTATPSGEAAFCPSCGHAFGDGDLFCSGCGAARPAGLARADSEFHS